MALLRCPDCARDVSDVALACQGCGRPVATIVRPSAAQPNASERTGRRGIILFGAGCVGIFSCSVAVSHCGGKPGVDQASIAKAVATESKVRAAQEAASARDPDIRAAVEGIANIERIQTQTKADVEALQKLTPGERAKRLREACERGPECPSEATDHVINAAANDGERAKLQDLVGVVLAKRNGVAAKEATAALPTQKDRVALADVLDTTLLAQHLNPEGVHAYGKTLHFDGWFCSRQFLFDFQSGPMQQEAQAAGFTRVECSNGLETWGQAL